MPSFLRLVLVFIVFLHGDVYAQASPCLVTDVPTNDTAFPSEATATVVVTGEASDISSISCTCNKGSASYYAVIDVEPTDEVGLGYANVCYLTAADIASDSLSDCAVAQLKKNETSLYHTLGTAESHTWPS